MPIALYFLDSLIASVSDNLLSHSSLTKVTLFPPAFLRGKGLLWLLLDRAFVLLWWLLNILGDDIQAIPSKANLSRFMIGLHVSEALTLLNFLFSLLVVLELHLIYAMIDVWHKSITRLSDLGCVWLRFLSLLHYAERDFLLNTACLD
ncbi:hypothetical protein GQ457_03G021620 [Hibiscus cannabinus]